MDAILEECFQRVETALNTLIDSITTYNPSVQAAGDLVAADDEFSKGLEQLARHQANHARILKLRQTSDNLDNQIKSTVSLLADTRKELLAIPSASDADIPTRDVPFDELLAFAKNIAKFTVPPTYRPTPPKLQDANTTAELEPATESLADITMTNGGSAHSPSQAQTQLSPSQTAEKDGEENTTKEQGTAFTQLTLQQKAFLEDMSKVPFMPWPDHDLINRGNLKEIQELIKKGIDPASVLTEEQSAANEARERAESEEKKVEEAKQREAKRQAATARQQGSVTARGQGQAQPAFEGFALYDPDEEDMDENE